MLGQYLSPEQLSSIAGYMSLSCWIVVYTPQIWENYQLQSGEGLSVSFIILWLLGDLTNLFGGIMAHLLPTIVLVAIYYSLCDLLLLYQVYYYRWQKAKRLSNEPTESSLLLRTAAPPTQPQPKPLLSPAVRYLLLMVFVFASGVVGWYIDSASTDEINIPEQPGKGADVELEWRSQVLGWISAVLYLGSRVPQISHNYKTRCAGLSLTMFFFSIWGNATYVASILFESWEPRYLIANASWLAGSGVTILLDLFVLAQFIVFSIQDSRAKRELESEPAQEA